MVFLSQKGDADSVDVGKIDKWKQELSQIIENLNPENVYNLDETSLFYALLPNKSFGFEEESRKSLKQFKTRITLVCITNATGSDRKLIMIGKSAKPRIFRGVKKLPIQYYSQVNSWMDSEIYEKVFT